jgi:hypothetical protein
LADRLNANGASRNVLDSVRAYDDQDRTADWAE